MVTNGILGFLVIPRSDCHGFTANGAHLFPITLYRTDVCGGKPERIIDKEVVLPDRAGRVRKLKSTRSKGLDEERNGYVARDQLLYAL